MSDEYLLDITRHKSGEIKDNKRLTLEELAEIFSQEIEPKHFVKKVKRIV